MMGAGGAAENLGAMPPREKASGENTSCEYVTFHATMVAKKIFQQHPQALTIQGENFEMLPELAKKSYINTKGKRGAAIIDVASFARAIKEGGGHRSRGGHGRSIAGHKMGLEQEKWRSQKFSREVLIKGKRVTGGCSKREEGKLKGSEGR